MKKTFRLILLPLFIFLTTHSHSAKIVAAVSDSAVETPDITNIKDALSYFNSLPRSEKKIRFREIKKGIKDYKAARKAGNDTDSDMILQVVLALFLPPLAVYLHEGETNKKFWISVLLTVLGLLIFGFAGVLFLGTLPSIIYALVVILSNN